MIWYEILWHRQPARSRPDRPGADLRFLQIGPKRGRQILDRARQPDAPLREARLYDGEIVVTREALHFLDVVRCSAARGRERLTREVRPSRRQLRGSRHLIARRSLRGAGTGAGTRPEDDGHFDSLVRIDGTGDSGVGKRFLFAAGDDGPLSWRSHDEPPSKGGRRALGKSNAAEGKIERRVQENFVGPTASSKHCRKGLARRVRVLARESFLDITTQVIY